MGKTTVKNNYLVHVSLEKVIKKAVAVLINFGPWLIFFYYSSILQRKPFNFTILGTR